MLNKEQGILNHERRVAFHFDIPCSGFLVHYSFLGEESVR